MRSKSKEKTPNVLMFYLLEQTSTLMFCLILQRLSEFLTYRRLFMDIEREQVKEHQRRKKHLRRIARCLCCVVLWAISCCHGDRSQFIRGARTVTSRLFSKIISAGERFHSPK